MDTPSVMVGLGTDVPDFTLPDRHGAMHSVSDFDAPALLVAFVCNHCPFVKHIENVFGSLVSNRDGLDVVAICSNDTRSHPDDGPEGMAAQARRAGWSFPYLIDDSQQVARAFKAACTPDFFLYGADRRLSYRGQLDDARPGKPVPVTGSDLDAAINAAVAGQPPVADQKPSIGCNIKWRDS